MDKKWLIGIFTSVFVVAGLVGFRDHLGKVWASPEKVESIEKKVDKATDSQEAIAKLVLEQKSRMDQEDAVTKVQMEAMKEQLALIAELKKKR